MSEIGRISIERFQKECERTATPNTGETPRIEGPSLNEVMGLLDNEREHKHSGLEAVKYGGGCPICLQRENIALQQQLAEIGNEITDTKNALTMTGESYGDLRFEWSTAVAIR